MAKFEHLLNELNVFTIRIVLESINAWMVVPVSVRMDFPVPVILFPVALYVCVLHFLKEPDVKLQLTVERLFSLAVETL